jgi:hypothetical protein
VNSAVQILKQAIAEYKQTDIETGSDHEHGNTPDGVVR